MKGNECNCIDKWIVSVILRRLFSNCNVVFLVELVINTGFVHVLKTLGFQKSNFKALKALEIDFWSLKVLVFLLIKIEKY